LVSPPPLRDIKNTKTVVFFLSFIRDETFHSQRGEQYDRSVERCPPFFRTKVFLLSFVPEQGPLHIFTPMKRPPPPVLVFFLPDLSGSRTKGASRPLPRWSMSSRLSFFFASVEFQIQRCSARLRPRRSPFIPLRSNPWPLLWGDLGRRTFRTAWSASPDEVIFPISPPPLVLLIYRLFP